MPSRELIANSIESMAQINLFDGLVLLGSCDKIVPGMLMAAARLDIPCIFLPGGPMEGGVEFDGRQADQTSSTEAYGMLSAGKITEEEYVSLENTACPGCGSCSYLGTANTMCALAEALGMTLRCEDHGAGGEEHHCPPDHHRRRYPQCHQGLPRHERLHQRRHAPHCHRL